MKNLQQLIDWMKSEQNKSMNCYAAQVGIADDLAQMLMGEHTAFGLCVHKAELLLDSENEKSSRSSQGDGSNSSNAMLPAVPVRIQRSRQHKQVSPNGLETVYVGRPGKWGNPYKVTGEPGHWFVLDGEEPVMTFDEKEQAIDCCIELFREYIAHEHNRGKLNVHVLRGKNLSCWCPKNCKCHADVLLELANR